MKNFTTLLLGLSILSISISQAQTEQGNVIVGLSTSLSGMGMGSDFATAGKSTVTYKWDDDEEDGDESFNFNLMPKVGYFIADNFAIGLDVNAMYAKTEGKGYSSYELNEFLVTAGPFIRYYVPVSTVMPFFEIGGSIGKLTQEIESSGYDDDSEMNIQIINGGAGIAFAIGEHASFDFLVGYNRLIAKPTEDNDINYREIYETIGVRLGFSVYL